jgi:hypothetical protein
VGGQPGRRPVGIMPVASPCGNLLNMPAPREKTPPIRSNRVVRRVAPVEGAAFALVPPALTRSNPAPTGRTRIDSKGLWPGIAPTVGRKQRTTAAAQQGEATRWIRNRKRYSRRLPGGSFRC